MDSNFIAHSGSPIGVLAMVVIEAEPEKAGYASSGTVIAGADVASDGLVIMNTRKKLNSRSRSSRIRLISRLRKLILCKMRR